jgi:hypothetical protein
MAAKTTLSRSEQVLYHQVHPLKLATDIGAQIVSLYFFWTHQLIWGLVAMFVPPPIASFALLRLVDFAYVRDSALGRYLARYMTPAMVAVRLLGTVPMVVGAWLRVWWLIPLGVAITLFGWLRGLLFPSRG